MADRWSAMLEQLVAYRNNFGTTDVSSRDSNHARLGRWIAAQRHRRRKGLISAARVRKLNEAGMVWSPGDDVWLEMLKQLREFSHREGHCNIPEHYPPNQRLASWAHNQRYRKRRGDLAPDRAAKLEKIGFKWAIYRARRRTVRKGLVPRPSASETGSLLPPAPLRRTEERLYRLRQGVYVQYSGNGKMPESLVRQERLNGELPPYIPLPRVETTFHIQDGDDESETLSLSWSGKGPLPQRVLEYVRENGCLPRHTY